MAEETNNGIVVSFDGVKVKEFRAYWIAVARGDFDAQDRFFARVVKRWPYELDPGDPKSYGELTLDEFQPVRIALQAASARTFKSFFGAANV